MSVERPKPPQDSDRQAEQIAPFDTVDLTPEQAASLIHTELSQAGEELKASRDQEALDGYVCALGLALQLGPAATEQVLVTILQAAAKLACRLDARGLSALGPALVELVSQVRVTGVLPPTGVMEAWATVAEDLGGLIGQVGLVLALPSGHRTGMLNQARHHATLLDDATGSLFDLAGWIDELQLPERFPPFATP
jgi:hypothetical protein